MAEKQSKKPPPYATYSAFVNFINSLRDIDIPSRIDPSVFGKASGSLTYSIISALKSLGLIDGTGVPTEIFVRLVKASDADRKPIWQEVLKSAYPTLWGGKIDLKTATAGQFDEHIREEYEVKGSTIDKVATFFISAANSSGVPLSVHLKARKQIASSSTSKKTPKQRKSTGEDGGAGNGEKPNSITNTDAISDKALEYKLVDLMKDNEIGDEQRTAIWTLIQYLTSKVKNKAAG